MIKKQSFIKKHGFLGGFNEFIGRMGLYIAVLFLVIMLSSVMLQILSRAFRAPIGWTEQLSVTAMVWITFLVAPYAYRRHLLAKIEIILDYLKGRAHYMLLFILHILEFIILIFAIYYAWKFFEGGRSKLPALTNLLRDLLSPFVSEDTLYSINFRARWSYIILPVSFFFMWLVSIEHMIRSFASILANENKTTLSFIDIHVEHAEPLENPENHRLKKEEESHV